MNITNTKQGNKIIRTTVEELPLYSCRKTYVDEWDIDTFTEDLINDGLLFCLPRYRQLHQIKISTQSDKPFTEFQEQVKKEYGDNYNYYWIHCLSHSGEYYSISEGAFQHTNEFTVRNWDTSNAGFVAVPKDLKISLNYISGMLTDLSNGSIYRYDIIDNEKDETVETYYEFLHATTKEQREFDVKNAKENYNIDLDDIELEY